MQLKKRKRIALLFLTQVTEGMVAPCNVIKEKNKFEGKCVFS